LSCLAGAIALIGCAVADAQTQTPPAISKDEKTQEMKLDWQSPKNRTFFLQFSNDLQNWSYNGTLDFGIGHHQELLDTNAPTRFFRLRYSDLPIATLGEAQSADFDLDGLSNLAELQESRTDPLGKDTDGDGLPDGWEVAHWISPLDNGSIDPANGPDGEFRSAAVATRALTAVADTAETSPAVVTNANAYAGGVQAHRAATPEDKDGDGIPNALDAGPLSRSIDWQGAPVAPKLVYIPLAGYDSTVHEAVLGCNRRGDVLASRALFTEGSWHMLAKTSYGAPNYLPIKIRVDGREHNVYLKYAPLPTSVADDGKIVGSATVFFESIEEEIRPLIWASYEPAPTKLAFIWDSWAAPPRLLAHASGSVLDGNAWDESAEIAPDGTVIVRQRVDPTNSAVGQYRHIRYDPAGGESEIVITTTTLPARIGEHGFLAFHAGSGNACAWLPAASSPVSLLSESSFTTSSTRTSFVQNIEPTYIGTKPGADGGYCLSFWGKAMIRHEGRWQEASELNGATLITPKGIAFNSKTSNNVQVWNGGQWFPLKDCVINKDLSALYVSVGDCTSDGRILISHYASKTPTGCGFLAQIDIEEVVSDQIAGNEANKLPTAYYGGEPNNPMLMATRTGTDARLAVKVNVPAQFASSFRVGARVVGQTTILGSAACSAAPAKTLIAFAAENGAKLYEIVAGFDANGNSALDSNEVMTVFQKTPKTQKGGGPYTGSDTAFSYLDRIFIVTEDDYVGGRNEAESYGGGLMGVYRPLAAKIVTAFATGSTSIAGAATDYGVLLDAAIPSAYGLSHPLGAKWNSLNQADTIRFVYPPSSELAGDVVNSNGLGLVIDRVIKANKAALTAIATSSWTDSVPISFVDNNLQFAASDNGEEVHVCLGACKAVGSLIVNFRARASGGIEVSSVNCYGAVEDLYDWSYGGPKLTFLGQTLADPKQPARCQAGHATLTGAPWPDAGRIFYAKVEFGTGVKAWAVVYP